MSVKKERYVLQYIAQYPVGWTAQSALHLPPLADLIIPTPTGLFTHIPTAVYSQALIYTAEWTGVSWRERKCPDLETAAKEIRTRALSIESPAFYCWVTMLHASHGSREASILTLHHWHHRISLRRHSTAKLPCSTPAMTPADHRCWPYIIGIAESAFASPASIILMERCPSSDYLG